MTFLLAVLGLSLTAAVADDAGSVEPPRPPGPALYADAPGDARHLFSLAYQGSDFESREHNHYGYNAFAVGYLGSWGFSGPFVHLNFVLPLEASENGVSYSTAAYYRTRLGGDFLGGWQHRAEVSPRLEGEVGAGLHTTVIWLPALAGYHNFSAMPVGFGLEAGVHFWPGCVVLGRKVILAAVGSFAVDFLDPLHNNDLRDGFTFRLGIAGGLGGRP